MRRLSLLLAFLLACSHATRTKVTPSQTPPMVSLPQPDGADVTLRLIVAGDGGEAGPIHTATFEAVRVLAEETAAPSLLLMPGDLTYPRGLPDDCSEARERLQKDYLSVVPSIPIVVVPGNHDHGDLEVGTNATIAARDAWFDCREQKAMSPLTGWNLEQCPCEPRWRAPLGTADVSVMRVRPATGSRPGVSIIAYDSQKALENPDQVAPQLEHALDALPSGDQAVILAHHPLESLGAHSEGTGSQDTGSPRYLAYTKAISEVVDQNPKVLLMVFGHDHSLQYSPGFPPTLISGAASKTSPVKQPAPNGGFAVGDTPGLATVDLLRTGETRVTLIWSGEPWVTTLPAPGLSAR